MITEYLGKRDEGMRHLFPGKDRALTYLIREEPNLSSTAIMNGRDPSSTVRMSDAAAVLTCIFK